MKLLFAALVSLAAAGCAASASTDGPQDTEAATEAARTGYVWHVPNPAGDFDVSISTTGFGCPGGMWSAEMGKDGQTLTLALSRFDAQLFPGRQIAVLDCTIQVGLGSNSGRSFAVGEFAYAGAAWLDSAGMSALQTAKYYFLGAPVPTNDHRTRIVGPFGPEVYQPDDDVVAPSDLVWSTCGTTSSLITQTRLIAQNNPPRTGTSEFNSFFGGDDDSPLRFRWKILSRECSSPPPPPPFPPPADGGTTGSR